MGEAGQDLGQLTVIITFGSCFYVRIITSWISIAFTDLLGRCNLD